MGMLVCGIFLLGGGTMMSSAATDPASVAWVCERHPDRVRQLFASLALDRPGFAAVSAAADRRDWPAACEALLAYYRDGAAGAWLRRPAPGQGTRPVAEKMLRDTFTFYTIEGTVPRGEDGGLQWEWRGPNHDFEWALALNRHQYVASLVAAYGETGNAAYARYVDAVIRDWVTANPYPDRKNVGAAWRGLEVSFRPKAWAAAFYGLMAVDALTPATRILLLSSLPDHARYLRSYHAGGNWATMEMSGLALIAAAWPEFSAANAWLDYATRTLTREITAQVYPDGVQKELTSHYHWVALTNFEQFAGTLRQIEAPLPARFTDGLRGMWHYLASSMGPDGANPLNNDSDRTDYRARVAAAAATYQRPDWLYIATNGERGIAPAHPSVVFPWAGQVVMRGGWDARAQWAFFDIGPWGIGHQHNDKLHLSLAAGGRELLVDGGRYTYIGGDWRHYFVSSAAHNVILVDGQGQRADAREADAAVPVESVAIHPAFDYARGTFSAGYADLEGAAEHTRVVIYLRGKYWVVIDRIETDRPRTITPLWHFHPDCAVRTEGSSVLTTDAGAANLRIQPVGSLTWTTALVRGQETPAIQGWYSRQYNEKAPATCAAYTAHIAGTTTTAWVLAPGDGAAPAVTARWLPAPEGAARLTVALPGEAPVEIAARLAGTGAVPLTGGLTLDGACAILRPGQPPLVAHGRILDDSGRVRAEGGADD